MIAYYKKFTDDVRPPLNERFKRIRKTKKKKSIEQICISFQHLLKGTKSFIVVVDIFGSPTYNVSIFYFF